MASSTAKYTIQLIVSREGRQFSPSRACYQSYFVDLYSQQNVYAGGPKENNMNMLSYHKINEALICPAEPLAIKAAVESI